jgi:hypothetical protein
MHHPQKPIVVRGFSPRANYTDRAIAACQRSQCQRLRIEGGVTWSARRIPTAVLSDYRLKLNLIPLILTMKVINNWICHPAFRVTFVTIISGLTVSGCVQFKDAHNLQAFTTLRLSEVKLQKYLKVLFHIYWRNRGTVIIQIGVYP